VTGLGPQRTTEQYFDRHTGYWRDIYAGAGIASIVYQRRMAAVLSWVESLGLQPDQRALDVGCGAGLMTVELAARGLQVIACDSSPAMVRQAEQTIDARGLGHAASVVQADAHELPFESSSVHVAVALGVIPWLGSPELAIAEMARLLAPGGVLILTADNARRLNAITEPFESPLATPLRPTYRAYRRWRRQGAIDDGAPFCRHRPVEVRRMLRDAGLRPFRQTTVGYGPFTFLDRNVLSDRHAIALDSRLNGWARRRPGLRRHGWHYVVAAEKPA
jgi:ubiquinone/menaquinone biosynthesis C-methylase UbiE